MKQLEQLSTHLQEKTQVFGSDILGEKQYELLTKFLQPLNLDVPLEASNLAFLAKVAQMETLFRPSVSYYGTDVLVNFYGLLFMPSGSGKDRLLKHINRGIMGVYYDRFDVLHEAHLFAKETQVDDDAKKKFESSKVEQERHIAQNAPRRILKEGNEGTVEGWVAQRQALAEANFGATNFYNSEFGDVLGKRSESDRALLTYLKDVYDGENKAKVIKGDKLLTSVTGVPSNFFGHSPIAPLLKDHNKLSLIEFLDSGMARRCLICLVRELPQLITDGDDVLKQSREIREKAADAWGYIKMQEGYFRNIMSKIETDRRYRLTNDASDALDLYKILCDKKANTFKVEEEGRGAEMRSRHFKALKLSVLLHILELEDGFSVSEDIMNKAIYQVEYYSKFTDETYRLQKASIAPDFYEVLVNNLDKKYTTTELITEVGCSRPTFYKYKMDIEGYIQDQADINDYHFDFEKSGKSVTYRLITKKQWELEKVH